MTRVRALAWILSCLLSCAAPATAAEWHEAYRDGVNALAQGEPLRAVTLLEYAASQRPQPGRNIVTYGTNVEARYYPYLRLAQAYIQVRDLAGARSAIRRSEKWAAEPVTERRHLAAQVEELAARLAPPASIPTPSADPAPVPRGWPETTTTESAPSTLAALPQEVRRPDADMAHPGHPESPGAASAPPAPQPRVATPSPARPSPGATEQPAAAAPAPAAKEPALTSSSIDIVSQPPGATVYLDDELIGTTDPEWGRLIKSGIASGRHRIRLALPGYHDLTEDVELREGSTRDFRRRL